MRKPMGWCVLTAFLLLPACDRKPDTREFKQAQTTGIGNQAGDDGAAMPPPPPPLPDSSIVVGVISVVSEDGDALDADVYVAKSPDTFDDFAHVERPGPASLSKPCQPGQRFQARPVIEDFRQGKLLDCAPRLDFVMYSVQRTFNISREGQDALDAGNLLLAQERLGLAADRYEFTEPAQARRLRLMSIAAAGRLLGVAHPIDSQAAQPVASEELRQRVRAFQAEHDLEATGELDARTRAAISRMQLRGTDVVVPPATQVPPANAPLADPRATVPASIAATSAAATAAATHVETTDLHTSVQRAMTVPASPENAAIIHGNRMTQRK